MLCSVCKKKTAIIIINKPDGEGKTKIEGLCYDCAKEKGINPFDAIAMQANISDQDLQDMTKQFESMFKDMSDNLNEEDLKALQNMADVEQEQSDNGSTPLGSIFSGLFGNSGNKSDASFEGQPSKKGASTTTAQKEKKEKRFQEKILRYLWNQFNSKSKKWTIRCCDWS